MVGGEVVHDFRDHALEEVFFALRCGYGAARSDPGALHGRGGWVHHHPAGGAAELPSGSTPGHGAERDGQDARRIRQIFRSGTVVFHFYRYWWTGFDIEDGELAGLLARFPDPDPSREFRAADCTLIAIESGQMPPRPAVEIQREAISRRGLFRRRTFWDAVLAEVASAPVAYQGYSFGYHADLYRLELTPESRARLIGAASTAPREMRKELQAISNAARIVFVCPRPSA